MLANPSAAPIVYFLNGISLTLAPGRTVTRVPTPRDVTHRVLDDLIALADATTDKQDRKRLEQAIGHVRRSLESELWADETHLHSRHGDKVFGDAKDAVNQLRAATGSKSTIAAAAVQKLINGLAMVARELAVVAIGDALAAGGESRAVVRARTALADGDVDFAGGRSTSAIEQYRDAWREAVR